MRLIPTTGTDVHSAGLLYLSYVMVGQSRVDGIEMGFSVLVQG
jgi:hypothetical protein